MAQHRVQQVCVHLDRCVAVEKPQQQQQQPQQQQQQGLQGLCDHLLGAAFAAHEDTLQQLTMAIMQVIEGERLREANPNPQHRKLTLMYIHLNVSDTPDPRFLFLQYRLHRGPPGGPYGVYIAATQGPLRGAP